MNAGHTVVPVFDEEDDTYLVGNACADCGQECEPDAPCSAKTARLGMRDALLDWLSEHIA